MNSWKHDTWTFAVSFAFVCGIALGGFICSLWNEHEVEVIYPSPVVYFEGKRSEPGRLAPETINAIEIQTARELFGGKMRDPFTVKTKGGRSGPHYR